MFPHLVEELRRRHPNFGYLHVIEPRVRGVFDRDDCAVEEVSNDLLRAISGGKPWISAGRFSRDSAINQADEKGEPIAFGRYLRLNVSLIAVISSLLLFSVAQLTSSIARSSYSASEKHTPDTLQP